MQGRGPLDARSPDLVLAPRPRRYGRANTLHVSSMDESDWRLEQRPPFAFPHNNVVGSFHRHLKSGTVFPAALHRS